MASALVFGTPRTALEASGRVREFVVRPEGEAESVAGAAGGAAGGEEGEDGEYEELIPPENFAMIEKGLYRSGFPKKKNFAFLRKSLRLKSILTLVLEDYPLANSAFNRQNGITLLQFGVPGNKARPACSRSVVSWPGRGGSRRAADDCRSRLWTSPRRALWRRCRPYWTSAITRCSSTATRARHVAAWMGWFPLLPAVIGD